jgi:hypothetical protein
MSASRHSINECKRTHIAQHSTVACCFMASKKLSLPSASDPNEEDWRRRSVTPLQRLSRESHVTSLPFGLQLQGEGAREIRNSKCLQG